jgi:hypothetical protein
MLDQLAMIELNRFLQNDRFVRSRKGVYYEF